MGRLPAHPEHNPTVKRLYAHAFRCARPNCTRPLYKQDNDTGERILNSRIAHIHARRPGGPRWIQMSAEDNRSGDNLLLLCIEHSYEIDEHPDSYPAEMLRQWKQVQLEEYEQLQRNWPLTDTDAGRVLEASSQALEHQHAGAVVAVVRAAERLALTARRARSGPATAAAAWRAVREQARRSFTGWDDDGNPVHAEPPRAETTRSHAALQAALIDVAESLAPLADEVKVELAAVRASRPVTGPWTEWVTRAADEALAASSAWPGPPGLEDDGRLEESLSELARATDALAAAWRGEKAEPPPPVQEKPTPAPAGPDPLEAHRALLDRARPYSRVHHKLYDPELRAQLAAAAAQAAQIPPVMSAIGVGLSTTCALAAAVAANATDEQLAALAEQDAQRRPLSTAVLLLAETTRVARNRGRTQSAAPAEAALAELWNSIDFTHPSTFDSDDANGRAVLEHGARITSPEQVLERLQDALAATPEILIPMVGYCAEWLEAHSSDDWHLLGIRRRYSKLPAWFPTTSAVAAATAEDVSAVKVDNFGETQKDDPRSLLAQVLWLAQRPSD